jgi:hypothetical protein
LAAHQATVLTWDILRYQQMKIGVLRSPPAAGIGVPAPQNQSADGVEDGHL